MNPFFEQRWPDVHTRLITYISDALQERLPADLVAGAEEQVVTIGDNEVAERFRPDIQVRQPWVNEDAGGVAVAPPPVASPAATEPLHVLVEEKTERRVVIHDRKGRLVSVIEVLSPANKEEGPERSRYVGKRRALIRGGVNLVEIDLVRQGRSVFADEVVARIQARGVPYAVSVWRATRPAELEVYPIGLRDRLPNISVPLRPRDADVVLELQPLIDQCHSRGRYHLLDYQAEPFPPFPAEDAAWVDQELREHELR
ncbi:MAG: DUF4058 family protein [Verrucomicrobiae bacterium]|nr:DUF4058 family protein [Verrucomicrobiae bacterium]